MTAPDIATALAGGADIGLALLPAGPEAGRGGQGLVRRLDGVPAVLFKRYLEPRRVHGPALAELVALRLALPPDDRDRLDAQAAWPLCRVVDGPRCVGFLMREAPASMSWRTASGASRLTEAQHLLYPEKPATQGVVRPDPEQRLALVLELLGLIDRLHRLGLVIGDLSHANVLWSVRPGRRCTCWTATASAGSGRRRCWNRPTPPTGPTRSPRTASPPRWTATATRRPC